MEKKTMTNWMIFWIVVGILSLAAIVSYTLIKLRELNFKCKHEWKTVKEIDLVNDDSEKIGKRYIQQCVHCGDVRHIDCC